MSFSNPAGAAREAGAAYTSALLAVLGDTDPMGVLRSQTESVMKRIAGLTDRQLDTPEAPGKWSIRQVVEHLADTEMVYGFRSRMIVSHDRPPLQGYDQDLWARTLHSERGHIGETLEELALMRRRNIRFVANLTDAELDRVGLHAERGEESVRRVVALVAAHDLVHLRQIDRIRAVLRV
jgi:hypothetical protein